MSIVKYLQSIKLIFISGSLHLRIRTHGILDQYSFVLRSYQYQINFNLDITETSISFIPTFKFPDKFWDFSPNKSGQRIVRITFGMNLAFYEIRK
jgi:hypothetical protein